MVRTRYPYGTRVRLSNPKYKRKIFYFLRLEKEQAVIFNWGQSDSSSFALFVNPLKVFRKKDKVLSPSRLALLARAVLDAKAETVEENCIHSFPIELGLEESPDELVCVKCNHSFKRSLI